jgi:hypothetical protein
MQSDARNLDVLKAITMASMLSSAALAAAFCALSLPQSAYAADPVTAAPPVAANASGDAP